MNPVTVSKTTNRIPPPGPNLSTFGVNPLYRAENLKNHCTLCNRYCCLPFLLGDGPKGGEGPIVLYTDRPVLVLDSSLSHVKWGIKDGSKGSTNGTSHEICKHLSLWAIGLGQGTADTMDDTKVPTIPHGMPPNGGLESFEEGKWTFLF